MTLPELTHAFDRQLVGRMAARHAAGDLEFTARELADDLGVDQNGGRQVPGALDRLETLGYVTRRRVRPQRYRLTDDARAGEKAPRRRGSPSTQEPPPSTTAATVEP
jgi:predicted ArsR family transcriptional regulator